MEACGFEIVGVFFYPGDEYYEISGAKYPSFLLPRSLRGSFASLRRSFSGEEPASFVAWARWFDTLNIELGLVFYASWIPPQLFRRVPMGMVNYHPGPLPELPGYEPETMAVLLGLERYYGTLHRVDELFDHGEILWYSPAVQVSPQTGPAELLYLTTAAAVRKIPQVLKLMLAGKLQVPEPKDRSTIVYASKKACQSFAVIDWQRDAADTIIRKNLAFNEQEISLRLLALYEGVVHVVLGVWKRPRGFMRIFLNYSRDPKPQLPGDQIGRYWGPGPYRGCPIVATLSYPIILKLLPRKESALLQRAKQESSRHRRYFAEK